MNGIVEGGWEFVITAYAGSWVVWVLYVASLWARRKS